MIGEGEALHVVDGSGARPLLRSMMPSLFCTGFLAFLSLSSSASDLPIAYATQRESLEKAGRGAERGDLRRAARQLGARAVRTCRCCGGWVRPATCRPARARSAERFEFAVIGRLDGRFGLRGGQRPRHQQRRDQRLCGTVVSVIIMAASCRHSRFRTRAAKASASTPASTSFVRRSAAALRSARTRSPGFALGVAFQAGGRILHFLDAVPLECVERGVQLRALVHRRLALGRVERAVQCDQGGEIACAPARPALVWDPAVQVPPARAGAVGLAEAGES